MITVITGAPGSGKSAALVDLLQQLAKGRAIYADGIPDLKVPHFPIEVSKWPDLVPDGAAVVVDEVQRVWRPRGPGQRVPADIAALETHRHRGLDFFLVTQAPRLIDANVRALVGRHVHLRDLGFLGRWWYEWPEISDSLAWRSAPIKKRYKLPKRVFALYRSASMHVKPVRSVPWMLLVMVLALIATGLLVWRAFGAVSSRLGGGESAPMVQGQVTAAPVSSVPGHVAAAPMTGAAFAASFVPRVSAMPESAPVYDGMRQVKVLPTVVGAVCSASRCKCVTEQGTDAGLDSETCRAWLANPPFNPFREPPRVEAVSVGSPVHAEEHEGDHGDEKHR